MKNSTAYVIIAIIVIVLFIAFGRCNENFTHLPSGSLDDPPQFYYAKIYGVWALFITGFPYFPSDGDISSPMTVTLSGSQGKVSKVVYATGDNSSLLPPGGHSIGMFDITDLCATLGHNINGYIEGITYVTKKPFRSILRPWGVQDPLCS